MNIDRPSEAQYARLRELWQEAFGDPDEYLDSFFAAAFSPDRCRCVTEDGAVTAALYWFGCYCYGRPVAYLYAVATAKSHRGRGLCHALMADTHRHLADMGFAGTILVPGEPSLIRFYETMGYALCTSERTGRYTAGEEPAGLRPLSAGEYGAKRREYLGAGGVIQEGENLKLLETMAEFYAGDGFIVSVIREGDRLTVPELLGDESAAPGIIKALGCREGIFHSPSAMYRPLDDSPAPDYFAFSFG